MSKAMSTQFRLRSAVRYVSAGDGIFFRHGDAFLQMKGKHVWEIYQRIKPLLEAKVLSSEERSNLLGQNAPLWERIFEKLHAAGMLYDAADDDRSLLPVSVQDRYAAQLTRLEAQSNTPVKTFAAIRARRVLIAGPAAIVVSIVEAALESGLQDLALWSQDWTQKNNAALQALLERHATDADRPVAEVLDHLPAPSTSAAYDYLVWAVEGESAPTYSEKKLLASCLPTFVLHLGEDRVVAGMVATGGGGCERCLSHYGSDAVPAVSSQWKKLGAVPIGARLVIQHLWDVAAEPSDGNTQHTILELDLHGYTIRRRPRPISRICTQCSGPRCVSDAKIWLSRLNSANETTDLQIYELTEKLLVDPHTGLTDFMDEGELMQYPYHHCAARLPGDGVHASSVWLTDSGKNLAEARSNLIRRVMETYCARRMKQDGDAVFSSYYRSSGELCRMQPAELPVPGLVVAARNWQELLEEGFYRALAQHAYAQKEWLPLNIASALPTGDQVSIIAGHLRDTGALDAVTVHQYTLPGESCIVLRFDFHAEPISIIAGSDWNAAWETGLRDIWMHQAASRSVPQRYPGVRLRAAHASRKDGTQAQDIASLEKIFGLSLRLVPVEIPYITTLTPFTFAHACIC